MIHGSGSHPEEKSGLGPLEIREKSKQKKLTLTFQGRELKVDPPPSPTTTTTTTTTTLTFLWPVGFAAGKKGGEKRRVDFN